MITVRNLDRPPETTQPEVKPLYISTEPIKTIEPELDIIHTQAKLAAKLGAGVTITGAWVWAQFNKRPSIEVSNELKANRWVWCKNKGKWAYRGKLCQSHKYMPWDYILNKYGEEKIQEKMF